MATSGVVTTNITSGVSTSAGTRIFIGSLCSAQPDPSQDTYVEIAEVTSIPEYGRTYGQITHSSLGNSYVRKFKGTIDDGNLQLDCALAGGDAGQAAARVALGSQFDYNFKIVHDDQVTPTGSPSIDYFGAKVMAFPTIVGGNMQVTMGRIVLGIQSGTTSHVAAS